MQNHLDLIFDNQANGIDLQLMSDLINVLGKKTCFWCDGRGHWLNDCGNYRVLKKYSREDPTLQEAFEVLDKKVQAKVKLGEVFLSASSREGMEAYVGALFKGQQVLAPTPENVATFVETQLVRFQHGVIRALKDKGDIAGESDDMNKAVEDMLKVIDNEAKEREQEAAAAALVEGGE